MIYLESFTLPSGERESDFLQYQSHAGYDTFYPFELFPYRKGLTNIDFDDITIFCGSNGSGKSTILNVIAETIGLQRDSHFNKTDFFEPYVNMCHYYIDDSNKEKYRNLMRTSRIITSDDVFNHILEVRKRNENLGFKREILSEEKSDMALNGWQGPRGFNADDK